jgi:hypothetical protein
MLSLNFKRLARWFFLLAVMAFFSAAPAQADHIKLFLLGGQSNMVGTGADTSGLPTALQSPQDDVLFYWKSDVGLTTLRPGSGINFGPEVTFGRTIADAFPAENFGLIKYAASGSDLVNAWDKDTGTVYANFRDTVADGLAALTAAGHTYEIIGMLWTQGERDARIGRTTAEYEADLIEFIADIRSRYGANLPFFLNRLSTGQTDIPDITEVRAAQENVTAADPYAFLIDADGMSFHDELHFDAAGQIALGQAFGQSYINYIIPDTTDPLVDTLSPANGSPNIPITDNLVIHFDEPVAFGTGSITIRETVGGAVFESYDVASPPANLILGGSGLAINPTADFANSTGYYVEIDASAIDDLAGNSFAGFSGNSVWAFTTEAPDLTDPTLSTFNPSNGDPSVAIASNLEITFSEDVAFGTGFITIRESAGGTVVESYDAANPPANLSINGYTLTIDPTALLAYSTSYYVEIDATAIDDLAGNRYVGFSGSSTWAFTTTDDPTAGLIGGGTGSGITVTASSYNTGGAGFPPIQTIDGSGLTDGVHANTVGTSWLTPNTNPSDDWIQWDLGDSYILDLIQVWNVNNNGNNGLGTKSVDIYFSNVVSPGDPEGAGAANWTKLGGTSLTLPQAPASNNTGFDLATATSTTLPATPVRYIRFELNSNWLESNTYTGIAEIQFFAAPVSSGNTFSDWISEFTGLGGLTALNDDADGDGIDNGVENYFGTHPGQANAGPADLSTDGTTTTFTHPQNENPATDLTAFYEWSPNLSDWYAGGFGPSGGPVVTLVPVTDGTTTTVTATAGEQLDRLFLRVGVEQD